MLTKHGLNAVKVNAKMTILGYLAICNRTSPSAIIRTPKDITIRRTAPPVKKAASPVLEGPCRFRRLTWSYLFWFKTSLRACSLEIWDSNITEATKTPLRTHPSHHLLNLHAPLHLPSGLLGQYLHICILTDPSSIVHDPRSIVSKYEIPILHNVIYLPLRTHPLHQWLNVHCPLHSAPGHQGQGWHLLGGSQGQRDPPEAATVIRTCTEKFCLKSTLSPSPFVVRY